MSCIDFVAVYLLVSCSCLEALRSAVWREVFTVDVVAPGFSLSLHAGSELDCARHCLHRDTCKTWAFHPHSATCWLYPYLLYYTTTGMASPGTGYFWRVSPSCPGELGYQLEAGICLKVYKSKVNRTEAEARCRSDGAHLLIADSAEKIPAVLKRTIQNTWLGASDEDKEGDWRWVDGSVVAVPSLLWYPGDPDNWKGIEHFMELRDGQLNDAHAELTRVTACQIPV